MSTFCRSCGEHFRIKNGEAVKPAGAHVSGISTFREIGEVEVVDDTPLARHKNAIEAQPAPTKQELEAPAPEPEPSDSDTRPVSLTPASETGAETWLESVREEKAKAARNPIPDEKPEKSEEKAAEAEIAAEKQPEKNSPEEEKTDAAAGKKPEPKKSKPAKAKSDKKKSGQKEKKPSSEKQKNEPEEAVVTNPIALAAAEADAKKVQLEALEESQKKSGLGSEAQPREALAGGTMEAMFGGISTDIDVSMDAEKVKADSDDDDDAPSVNPVAEVVESMPEAESEDESDSPKSSQPDPAKMPVDYAPGKSKSKADANTKPIRCFKCNHRQNVSVAASSTQCGRCSVYISLSDYDIKSSQSQTIRTRGNVTIHRKGSLIGCDVACHHLTVLGNISGCSYETSPWTGVKAKPSCSAWRRR